MVLRKSVLTPLAVLELPVVLLKKAIDTGGRVLKARGVEEKGARSLRRVEVAGCVAAEGSKTDGRVANARSEGKSALSPSAVLPPG